METGLDEIIIADVVASIAGRDQGKLFYVFLLYTSDAADD